MIMKLFKYKSWKEYKSHLLTKWFIEWVNDEFDLETLAATRTTLVNRETAIKTMIDRVNHTEIKGFKND